MLTKPTTSHTPPTRPPTSLPGHGPVEDVLRDLEVVHAIPVGATSGSPAAAPADVPGPASHPAPLEGPSSVELPGDTLTDTRAPAPPPPRPPARPEVEAAVRQALGLMSASKFLDAVQTLDAALASLPSGDALHASLLLCTRAQVYLGAFRLWGCRDSTASGVGVGHGGRVGSRVPVRVERGEGG